MTPDQIALVEETFEIMMSDADALADAFYQRVFARWPELQPLFIADSATQRRKFIATLSTVVHALWRPETVMPLLGELGARHVGYGVQPAHYALIGAALIDTLQERLDRFASPEVLEAWSAAYTLIAAAMQDQDSAIRER